jgi:hypothetical protein
VPLVGQSQQIVKRISYPFLLLFRGAGIEFNSTSAFARYGDADKKDIHHLKTKPTGTRSRFVSSIRLRNDIAVVGGDCLLCAACCHHMKEVEDAEDTSDHDGP